MTGRDISTTVMWSPGIERDGDHWPVTISFTAGGFQPYVPATYWQPAEGGMFEDTFFVSAEMADEGEPPMTEVEIAAARAWFDSSAASDKIQEAARDAAPSTERDPDRARDETWDRLQTQDAFSDEELF